MRAISVKILRFVRNGKVFYQSTYGSQSCVDELLHVSLWFLATMIGSEEDIREIGIDPQIYEEEVQP